MKRSKVVSNSPSLHSMLYYEQVFRQPLSRNSLRLPFISCANKNLPCGMAFPGRPDGLKSPSYK